VEKDGDISLFSLQIDDGDGDGDGEWSLWLAGGSVVVIWWIDNLLALLVGEEEKARCSCSDEREIERPNEN
jgi:hypothetical protein